MLGPRDFEVYLPKYLSPETEEKLFSDLSQFPDNIDDRMYRTIGVDPDVIYQGDGLSDLLVVELPSLRIKRAPCLVLSNTCDMDPLNRRPFSTNVIYAPIMNMATYQEWLLERRLRSVGSINDRLSAIRRQQITQVFYLPPSNHMDYEGMVFCDRLVTCPNDAIDRNNLGEARLFSLSQYGQYLFLFKLSIHFTRVTEGVDRAYLNSSPLGTARISHPTWRWTRFGYCHAACGCFARGKPRANTSPAARLPNWSAYRSSSAHRIRPGRMRYHPK